MMDVTNKEITLKQAVRSNGLLVVFSCNSCPFVVGSDGSEGWRVATLLSANCASRTTSASCWSTVTKQNAMETTASVEMQAHYKAKGYNGHYLLDKNHVVADAFGARTTPHVPL
ncbi:MAG: hypothetical protein IPH53_22705 [Flavobacteriales bacterium]|nr:hypothetical protein [Flavobacteriales bacterium]